MFTWSRRSEQKFRHCGNVGAHKLIPILLRISCAPGLPRKRPRISSRGYQATGHPQRPIYRTNNRLGRLLPIALQMHATSCPAMNKIALRTGDVGQYATGPPRPRPRLTFDAARADTAFHGKSIRSRVAAIGLDHGSLCLIRTPEESPA